MVTILRAALGLAAVSACLGAATLRDGAIRVTAPSQEGAIRVAETSQDGALAGGSHSIFREVKAASASVGRFGRFELTVRLDSVYTNPYDYSDIALRCVFVSPSGRRDTVDGFYMRDYRIDTATGRLSESAWAEAGFSGGDRSVAVGRWGAFPGNAKGLGPGGGSGGDRSGAVGSEGPSSGYAKDSEPGGGSGGDRAAAAGHFAIRYSPREVGKWSYSLFCETRLRNRVAGPKGGFLCTASGSPGFVRRNASPYLSFDNDSVFIPIGENLGWAGRNPYLDYRRWITRLAAHKGNFIRVWMPAWGLGLEWQNGHNGYGGIGRYKQSNAALLDWMLDFCATKNVYVMLSLDHHGQVSSKVDPNWKGNPYNAANGGPCVNTWDFFTSAEARRWIRNRFRYIVARWGYSDGIMAWELFNEVDWTDDFAGHRADVAGWHEEMAGWLRRLDVNRHLITTSYGRAAYDSLTWRLPGIDFTQTHYYTLRPLDSVLSAANRHYWVSYGKPTLNGEFGLSGDGRLLAANDPGGIYVHNALWASMLSGAMGPGLSWWWDNYIDPQDLYVHFNGIAAFVAGMDFIGEGYAPAGAAVEAGGGVSAGDGVSASGGVPAGGDVHARAGGAASGDVRARAGGPASDGPLRAYILKSRDSSRIAGWVLNAGYTSQAVRAAGEPSPVMGGILAVLHIRNGQYAVCWYDCRTGAAGREDTVTVRDGVLRVACPAIGWDAAVKVWRVSGGQGDQRDSAGQ